MESNLKVQTSNPPTDIVLSSDESVLVTRDEFDLLSLDPDGDPGVWESLDGQQGTYRNRDTKTRPCLLQATNDWEAVAEFLATVPKSPQTLRSYQKECLRLLLFCRFYFRKLPSSLTLTDVTEYRRLLQSPPAHFVQPRLRKSDPDYRPVTLFMPVTDADDRVVTDTAGKPALRFNPHWRPFQKGLSSSSATTAMSVVKALMTFWVKTNYLSVSPFALVTAAPDAQITPSQDPRSRMALGYHAQRTLYQVIDALPTCTERQRLIQVRAAFVVECLLTLGVRMAELTRATMRDVHRDQGMWWFRAVGKGNKERQIPAVARFMRAYQDYRLANDLPEIPKEDEDEQPLVQYLLPANRGAISEYQIRKIVRPLFDRAADALRIRADATEDPIERMDLHADAEKLARATPHWLRHTYATNLHNAQVDPRTIKACLGHANLETTMIYSHTEARQLHSAVETAHSEASGPVSLKDPGDGWSIS